jgi:hypothetical protein
VDAHHLYWASYKKDASSRAFQLCESIRRDERPTQGQNPSKVVPDFAIPSVWRQETQAIALAGPAGLLRPAD